jgi:hypothetical protein
MGNLRSFRSLALAAVTLAGIMVPAHAQDADDQQRGVARISLMNGEVSVRRGDAGEVVAGVINAPLMTDDHISTAPNSRAEVQFDASNLIRIGGNAEVRLAQVSDGRVQLEVARGTVTYVVLRPSNANVEVDTPSVSVRPNKRGVYRISANEAGETQVMARAGEVEVFTPRGSEWVGTGKMMIARGNSADPEFQVVNAPPLDEWDTWNQQRDQQMLQSTSVQHVPQGVYGAEDLDQYGSWENVEPYGSVWRPTVAMGADWAPYRTGRWVWEDWYGWTWVSSDPWGWAPYHYGRWFNEPRFGWCWYPGVYGRHHYWSPALVAWFGFGGGGGIGFGFGNVGWVPLAPYETFHPWWGRGYYGRGFNDRINFTNINVSNVYRNSRFGGISGVGYNDFQSGRFHGISRFSGDQVRSAGLIRGQMPIAPGRNHLQYSDRAASFTPRNTGNTRFFSRQQPANVQRVPFEQQRSAFGRGTGGNVAQTPQQRGGFGSTGNTRPPAAQSGGGGGWRNFGDPGGRTNGGPAGGNIRQQPMDRGPQNRGASTFENSRPQAAPQNSGDGRRFGGNPQGSTQPLDRGPQNRGNWNRFGEPGSGAAPQSQGRQFGSNVAPQNTRPAPSTAPQNRGAWGSFGNPNSSPRTPAPSPRYGAPGGVVRERPSYNPPTPRYEAPRGGQSYSSPSPRGGFGGGQGSSPRQSAPSFSAPPSRPSGGGGGFGGGRPSGGGGGGGSAPRSSGGGGGGGGRPAPSSGGHSSGGGNGHGRR